MSKVTLTLSLPTTGELKSMIKRCCPAWSFTCQFLIAEICPGKVASTPRMSVWAGQSTTTWYIGALGESYCNPGIRVSCSEAQSQK